MEAVLKFVLDNWGWIATPTVAGVAVGVLKLLAKGLKWVGDDRIMTLIKGWLSGKYQTRAADQLPPMAERGETPEG